VRRSSGSRLKPRVSVLTATIPGREHLLAENKASVRSQIMVDWEHLTLLDTDLAGCSASYNALADEAQADWLFILADDDLILPGCLHQHLKYSTDADIVYSPPLVWGEDSAQFCMSHPGIPAVALIRTELWRKLRGYGRRLHEQEDRDFYIRAQDAQARFVRFVDGPTWVYRFHGSNKSRA
jgi:hypothetical protein